MTEGMRWDAESGELVYEFWKDQRRALDAYVSGEYDITVFLGGYGSGKTVTGARATISLAWENPGSKHLANAIDFQKGDETTFETLFEQLPGDRTEVLTSDHNGPESSPIVADYNRQKHRLTLINDSVIRLGSADHPDSVIGDEFQSAWLDEPSKYHPNQKLHQLGLDTVPSRLRAHQPQYGQLWTMTGNGYNAAYEIVRERINENGEDLDGWNIKEVRASVLDNPYLSDEVKQRRRRQYEGSAKAEQALHGGFAAAEGLVYDVGRDEHLVELMGFEPEEGPIEYAFEDPRSGKIVPIDTEYRLYGYDQGFDPDPRVLLELGRAVDGRIVLLDEFYRTRARMGDALRWLDGRVKGRIASEHMPEDIADFKDAGWDAFEANKSIEPGIDFVSEQLNPRDEDTGEPLPPRLLIAERCENTIKEFFSYKAEDIGGKAAKDHAMDSLRYALMAIKEGNDVGGLGFGTVGLGSGKEA